MLISKGLANNEVMTLKMVTGEELLARLVSTETDHYVVTKPLSIVISAKGIGLQQWLFTVEPGQNVKINKDKVIIIEPTDTQMAKQYIAGTTGLTVP